MLPATPQTISSSRSPPECAHPIFELMKRVRRAARNGSKLHLEPEHVRILLCEELYRVMSAIESKEMRAACEAATLNDNEIKSETSGCGNDPTAAAGVYAGSNIVPMEVMSRGARQQLSEAMSDLQRRKKH